MSGHAVVQAKVLVWGHLRHRILPRSRDEYFLALQSLLPYVRNCTLCPRGIRALPIDYVPQRATNKSQFDP